MKEIRISVRSLVEFLCRSGDLNSRGGWNDKEAMYEGARLHRKLQKAMGGGYSAEVPMRYEKKYRSFRLVIEGRADGIFTENGVTYIDEIKTVASDPYKLDAPVDVHLAQAKVYAAIHARSAKGRIGVRVRYCSRRTQEIRDHYLVFVKKELLEWFRALLDSYERWGEYLTEWEDCSRESVRGLEFPFEYRPGQKELAADIYRTILRRKRLFIQAPTGVGKTMSAVFPAVHAYGAGLTDTIFYLTAKTVTGDVAFSAFSMLMEKGVRLKTLCMSAKERICLSEGCECDPDECVYAKGHYDRINDALYELLVSRDIFTKEDIIGAAQKAEVCPYELQLDLTAFMNAVICDYNYVFDPVVSAGRLFAEKADGKKFLLLIDEAHNLVERGREMFSADLTLNELKQAKKLLKGHRKLTAAAGKCIRILEEIKDGFRPGEIRKQELSDAFSYQVMNLIGLLDELFAQEDEKKLCTALLDIYFRLRKFEMIREMYSEDDFMTYAEASEGGLVYRMYCVNPSAGLSKVYERAESGIFFSATLIPVNYYKKLLTGSTEDYAVNVPSPFDRKKRLILTATDVSSRYKRRGPAEYEKMARYLSVLAGQEKGKFMAFFPSYEMKEEVEAAFVFRYGDSIRIVSQKPEMSDAEKKGFLHAFTQDDERVLGFCVLGGVFSEGIDLTGEKLTGVAIIGTGLPAIGGSAELLKEFYNEAGEAGFDFAYRIPGMNKVLQAAGRLIRTEDDEGVIMLLDERFRDNENKRLLPASWDDAASCTLENAGRYIEGFRKSKADR